MSTKVCYYCGVELMLSRKASKISPIPNNAQTREHIPQKSLFEGIAESEAPNRITVFGCRKCNNDFSLVDEEIRNLIGLLKDDNATEQLKSNTFKSLVSRMKKEPERFRYKDGEIYSIGIDNEKLRKAHEKHFRALFYRQYNMVLPDQYYVQVLYVSPDDKKGEEWEYFANFLQYTEWKWSGNPNIFRYVIFPMRGQITLDKMTIMPTRPFVGDEPLIVGMFSYHNVYDVLLGARLKGDVELPNK